MPQKIAAAWPMFDGTVPAFSRKETLVASDSVTRTRTAAEFQAEPRRSRPIFKIRAEQFRSIGESTSIAPPDIWPMRSDLSGQVCAEWLPKALQREYRPGIKTTPQQNGKTKSFKFLC